MRKTRTLWRASICEDARVPQTTRNFRFPFPPWPAHLLLPAAAFSLQHLQQAPARQPPAGVHKHHALLQPQADVHGGGETHLRRPLKTERRQPAAGGTGDAGETPT